MHILPQTALQVSASTVLNGYHINITRVSQRYRLRSARSKRSPLLVHKRRPVFRRVNRDLTRAEYPEVGRATRRLSHLTLCFVCIRLATQLGLGFCFCSRPSLPRLLASSSQAHPGITHNSSSNKFCRKRALRAPFLHFLLTGSG
jgi:hypothetical protein